MSSCVDRPNREAARLLERGRHLVAAAGLDDADDDRLVGARSKRDAERAGHDDRKGKDPEDRLGLAQELLEARECELDQRVMDGDRRGHRQVLTNRASAGRSATRTRLRASRCVWSAG